MLTNDVTFFSSLRNDVCAGFLAREMHRARLRWKKVSFGQ
jgi:hypothetical protein